MSENKDNKLTLINEKTANDYLTHTHRIFFLHSLLSDDNILSVREGVIGVLLRGKSTYWSF